MMSPGDRYDETHKLATYLSSPGAERVPCAIICPLILTLDPCRGPIGDFKKTLVDIPDVGQKGVI